MKFFFYIVIFAMVFGTIYGVHYTTQVDLAKSENATVKEQMGGIASALAKAQDGIRRKQELMPYIAAAQKVQEELTDLHRQLAATKTETSKIQGLFATLVKRVRTEAPGTTIEEIRTQSGKMLKNVKILRLEGRDMSIAHDGGVTTLSASDLPEDLQFRFGYNLAIPGVEFTTPETMPGHKPIREVVIPPPTMGSAAAPKPKAVNTKPQTQEDRLRDGDPGLWNQVTKRELGMVYIPGQGWLRVGPKGPIPKGR